jgi:hypothetical protein
VITDQDLEQLKKLMKLMDDERCLKVTLADGTTVERAAFTPREKPKDGKDEQSEGKNPFGYADEDLFP